MLNNNFLLKSVGSAYSGKLILLGVCYTYSPTIPIFSFISSDGGGSFKDMNVATYETKGISLSSDGKYILICKSDGGSSYFSTDYGKTFSTVPYTGGIVTAMSYDGKYIIYSTWVSGSPSQTYRSTNNGSSWSEIPALESNTLTSAAISKDGKYMTVCSSYAGVYVSSDYGATWTLKSPTVELAYSEITMSSDGKYQYACTNDGYIWKSTDFGQAWTQIANDGSQYYSISTSADGKTVVVNKNYTGILKSTDYGSNWTTILSNTGYLGYNQSVDISSDGKTIMTVKNSNLYISKDGGNTWATRTISNRCIAKLLMNKVA